MPHPRLPDYLAPLLLVAAVATAGCMGAREGIRNTSDSVVPARLFLVSPRHYHVGGPVTVMAILANAGESPLMYSQADPRLDWQWRVTDEKGLSVSDEGRLPTSASNRTRKLLPGEAVVEEFDLRQLFDLPRGRYIVSAGRRVWHPDGSRPTDVRSATFPFKTVN